MLPTGTRVAIIGGTLDGIHQLQSNQGVVIDPYHNKPADWVHVHLDREAIVDLWRTKFQWDVVVHESQLQILENAEEPIIDPTPFVKVQESSTTFISGSTESESESATEQPASVPSLLEPVSLEPSGNDELNSGISEPSVPDEQTGSPEISADSGTPQGE